MPYYVAISSGKITWNSHHSFEGLERFLENNAHGFELEALVRLGALGYLMSAESNGVNRVNSCSKSINMENKNRVPLVTNLASVKDFLPLWRRIDHR